MVAPELVEEVEDSVGLAGAGKAGDKTVAGQGLQLDRDRAAASQCTQVEFVGRGAVLARAGLEVGRRLAHGDAGHAAAHADGEAEGRRGPLRADKVGQPFLALCGLRWRPGAIDEGRKGAARGRPLLLCAWGDDLSSAG